MVVRILCLTFKADDSNANLVEPEGTALYGGEWREQGEDMVGVGDPGGEEEIVLLSEVNGLAAKNEEKQSGITSWRAKTKSQSKHG